MIKARFILVVLAGLMSASLVAGQGTTQHKEIKANPGRIPASGAQEHPSLYVIDDGLRRDVEEKVTKAGKAGALPLFSPISSQLERTSCEITLSAPSHQAMRLSELYEKRVPGVLIVGVTAECPKCSNWHISPAVTAFALTEDGVCVTNYPVFAKADEKAHMVAATSDRDVYPVVEVLAASKEDDVVIFRIEAKNLRPIPLISGTPTGDDVCVLAHPMEKHYALTKGIVSRRAMKTKYLSKPPSKDNMVQTPILEITADYCVGSNGSAVMDMNGNAAGMVSSTETAFTEGKTPQMVFHSCVPAESILNLVKARVKR
jgi:serine protease Do